MSRDTADRSFDNALGPQLRVLTNVNKKAVLVLGVSILIACVMPQLLRFEAFGLGCSLSVLLMLGSGLCLGALFNRTFTLDTGVILLLMACLSVTFALRSSVALMGFSCFALVASAALLFSSRYSFSYRSVAISSWLLTPIFFLRYALVSCIRLVRLSRLLRLLSLGDVSQIRAIVLGLLCAAPLLYIFGALLSASDERFAHLLESVFDWDLEQGFESLIKPVLYWPIVVACLFASFKKAKVRTCVFGRNMTMNGLQLNVILFCLNLLFVTYILVQSSYFFGGDQLVVNTQGLTYANYAKGGFWELVWVALIALPLLVIAHWLQREASIKISRWFLFLASVMIVSIVILELSAVHRMALYIEAYGLTQLRFYASAFMLYIIVALVGFYLTVLKGGRGVYIAMLSISAMILILILNLINPSALIAKYNLKQSTQFQLDVNYLLGLGADAYPAIIEYKTLYPDDSDCRIKSIMKSRLNRPRAWVHWNYSEQRALVAVKAWLPKKECSKR